MAQEGEEMVRGPRFELGTPRFSAGCLKRRRGHKSLRHNVGSSPHSCKSFTALHRVARGNVYGIRYTDWGEDLRTSWLPGDRPDLHIRTSRGRKPGSIRAPGHVMAVPPILGSFDPEHYFPARYFPHPDHTGRPKPAFILP